MTWLLILLFVVGGLFSMAWHGAGDSNQTRQFKRTFGVLAVACWLALLALVNIDR